MDTPIIEEQREPPAEWLEIAGLKRVKGPNGYYFKMVGDAREQPPEWTVETKKEILDGSKLLDLIKFSTDPNVRRIEKRRLKDSQLMLIAQGNKLCERCRQILPLDEFKPVKKAIVGYKKTCVSCDEIYYLVNRTRLINNSKRWIGNNPRKIKEYRAKNKVERLKGKNRMVNSLSNVVKRCLQRYPDPSAPREYFGCSKERLWDRIQSLWLPGMTWDNYGNEEYKWSIDHIIPLNAFDFYRPNHMRWCCDYRNLQPLWGKDNRLKKDILPNGISVRKMKRETLVPEYRQYLAELINKQQGVSIECVLDSYRTAYETEETLS